ncbi:kinase-like protein [Clavulina sp. PMI_390]|nr:kinase-like protein [Clavulina sp. PMI_390]
MSVRSDRHGLFGSSVAINQLPTPAGSDSSRNTSPHSGYRRPYESGDLLDSLSPPNYNMLAYGSASDAFAYTSHQITLDTPNTERTNAFFTSQTPDYKLPTPPRRSLTLSSRASHDSELSDKSAKDSTPPATSRSNTESFFAVPPRTPSPPRSIARPSLNGSSKPSIPLARLFPSRYRRTRDVTEEEGTIDSPLSFSPEPQTFSPTAQPLPPSPPKPYNRPQNVERSTAHIRHETLPPSASQPPPLEGSSYESDDIKITYIRNIGNGAFSNVWLARDDEGSLSHAHNLAQRRPSESVARRRRDRKMHGLKPTRPGASLSFSSHRPSGLALFLSKDDVDSESAIVEQDPAPVSGTPTKGRLVAVKMIPIAACDADDRTRISFVREVEVLRHIAHPNIASYLHSYTTATHHCLVLEYIGGGELFSLVNSDEQFSRITEPWVRRMWGELTLAVGWMHGVGLVHRDIKLENILLTCNPFASSDGLANPEGLTGPLIKLTDFGLARFVDTATPLLTTRCGSEYYSAPEIIMAQPYDGRQTDAWACGVILFALVTRSLPFDADVSRLIRKSMGDLAFPEHDKRDTKRGYMVRIAKGEYKWPDELLPIRQSSGSTVSSRRSSFFSSDEGHTHHQYWPSPTPSTAFSLTQSPPQSASGESPSNWPSQFASASRAMEPRVSSGGWSNYSDTSSHHVPEPTHSDSAVSPVSPTALSGPEAQILALITPGVKRIVGRLLVRDPRKRAKLIDLWTDEWMQGPGAPLPPPEAQLGDETPMTEEPCLSSLDGHTSEHDDGGQWVPIFHSHHRSASGRLILEEGGSIPPVASQEIGPDPSYGL